MRISIYSEKGIQKKHSEDLIVLNGNVFYEESEYFPDVECKFIGIIDGVGGNEGGKDAAFYIANHLGKEFISLNCKKKATQEIQVLNDALLRHARVTPSKEQMAAVFTGIVFLNTSMLIMHIGNTRAYVMQGNYLKQLTKDHTMKEFYSQQGRYDEADLCNSNEIYACLGGGRKELAKPFMVKEVEQASSNAYFLMTSDGIHDHLKAQDMEKIMLQDIPDFEKIKLLSDCAIKAGSYDDRSIVIIRR